MIIAACIQAAQSVKSHTHIHTKSDFHLEITTVVMYSLTAHACFAPFFMSDTVSYSCASVTSLFILCVTPLHHHSQGRRCAGL